NLGWKYISKVTIFTLMSVQFSKQSALNQSRSPDLSQEKKGLAGPTLTLRLEEKTPGLLVFLSTNHNRSGRCHSNSALAKILPGGNRFWCNTPTKISPTGREPWQKNGYIP
ncbi:hypothetical protein P3471_23925, partial [Vibrio parahaemolyticus]|nr:hypothetical protein [Vibrio parahaemolyticus]